MTPIHERIHQAIVEAQERRSRLPGHGWVVPEQVAALGEANAILAEHELPELDMATIARLEIKAPGLGERAASQLSDLNRRTADKQASKVTP
jgi:hypothetical protein